ncbi:Argininosuccinate lyase [Colletotrichum siamense]|uniref:Argininosuccinate lyase n=1 Tax=Colletotrichum siamense TaxID=690259 RepID=UPI00187317EC|nr:Argininosuccinate lyase [Colletotrichum siamense]KAF5484900.1 Argininosuccinate lyase [Colletotrichum siamense]
MASGSKPAENKLWGGRFTASLLLLPLHWLRARAFTPHPLSQQGIYGSIAFARANSNNGILTQHEFEENERGLLEVEKEWEAGNFKIVQGDEDIHTANERRLSSHRPKP